MEAFQATQVKRADQEHFSKGTVDGAYDNQPFVEQVSRQIADIIKLSFIFYEGSTILLDYACGTGQMSRHLAPYTKKTIGVDISRGKVDYYNQRVYNQGNPPDKMQALCGQLTGANADLDGQKFDIIVASIDSLWCALAYHHFPNISAITKILTSLLKPGTGKLFVADLMTYQPSIFKQSPTGTGGHIHGNHSHSHAPEQHTHSHSHTYIGPHSHLPHPHSHSHSHSHAHSHSPEQKNHSHSHEGPYGSFRRSTVVRKGGFSESDIHAVFTSAGLVDWEFIEGAASAEIKSNRVDLFLAVGRRPAEGESQ